MQTSFQSILYKLYRLSEERMTDSEKCLENINSKFSHSREHAGIVVVCPRDLRWREQTRAVTAHP